MDTKLPVLADIRSGSMQVYKSGTVISSGSESVEFKFLFSPNHLRCELVFIDNKENDEPDIKVIPDLKTNKVVVTCTNFNNSIGTGTTKALKLGVVENKHFYLNFQVYAMQPSKQKVIHYTWYLEDPSDV
jgi:hypothetical protein